MTRAERRVEVAAAILAIGSTIGLGTLGGVIFHAWTTDPISATHQRG